MDRVTNFLLLLALILVIMCCLAWLLAGSCVAGYVATYHELPSWAETLNNTQKEKHFVAPYTKVTE